VLLSKKIFTDCTQRRGEALKVNISAGEGLQDVLKSNLGPLGTIKMFVSPKVYLSPWLTASRLVDGAGAVRKSSL